MAACRAACPPIREDEMERVQEIDGRRPLRLPVVTSPTPTRGSGQWWCTGDGRIVGTGGHAGPGHPHAEVLALAEAGRRRRGATLFVTLEPCAHHGRTPPCTDAIMAAGVAEVVAAVEDPDPQRSRPRV